MKYVCDNCQESFEESKIVPLPDDVLERLEPGGMVPSGQCPECGALVYPVNADKVYVVMEGGVVQAVYSGARWLDVEVIDHDITEDDGAEAYGQHLETVNKVEKGRKDGNLHLIL